MTTLADLRGKTRLPLIASPMFLVSGPDLVIAQCAAGVIGTFASWSARPQDKLDSWLDRIEAGLDALEAAKARPAPYGVNLIIHPTNPRWRDDLQVCVAHRTPFP